MHHCKCRSIHHDNHRGKPCDKPAAAGDQYCQECRDKTEKENAPTKTDMDIYDPR